MRACVRTPRTGKSAVQLGPHFGLIGTRRGQNPSKPSKMTVDMVLCAGWDLQPQTLPTACILSVLLAVLGLFKRPAAPREPAS